MSADDTKRRKLLKALKPLRTEHIELIKKVAKSRTKFEKRCRELRALEATISELMRPPEEPEVESLWAAALSEIKSQPANPVIAAHLNGNGNGQQVLG
jgi:hypothetical protein